MTSPIQIGQWFDDGLARGAAFMVVVVDTFDHSDYPVYVSYSEDVHQVVARYHHHNMQRVIEVYDFTKPKQDQLAMVRAGREYIPQ